MESEEVDISLPVSGLQGDISLPVVEKKEEDSGTLDEPVLTTLKRDVVAVGYKFTHVIFPRRSKQLLHDWDLWGPLCLCIALAILLQGKKDPQHHNPGFVEVFVIVWVGSFVVTMNSKLLGGTLSFFQSICTLGYCLLPLVLALILSVNLSALGDSSSSFVKFRLVIKTISVIAAVAWSVYAAFAFITPFQPQRRKGLALYPVFLFYFGIGFLILLRH